MSIQRVIVENDMELLRRIVAFDPGIVNRERDGIWAPFLAAQLGREEILRILVEYSFANLSEYDEQGRNLLHYATQSGSLSLVKYVTEQVGIRPDTGDSDNVTPYDIALASDYFEIQSYFESFLSITKNSFYRNPILTGMHPDPSIVCVGEDFYMVHSSFIFFPCIPISHSKDLIHWDIIGHAITNPKWSLLKHLEGGRGYWAPDISYHNKEFFITATYRFNDGGKPLRQQMIVHATNPKGPYSKPVYINEEGIDPSLFYDNEKVYMILNRGARIMELNNTMNSIVGSPKLLRYGCQMQAPEGAHLLKKDKYYYLFQAEGGTGEGHRISVSRSESLMGFYQPCPYNPIMFQTNPKAGLKRCGHGKAVQTPSGEWYMVYLCARQLQGKYTLLGRETALDPIRWTPDGWPIVNERRGASCIQKIPNLEKRNERKDNNVIKGRITDTACNKNDRSLCLQRRMEWVTPREPRENSIRWEEGGVRISADTQSMFSVLFRGFLLHRQEKFEFDFVIRMQVGSGIQNRKYGITGYYDENSFLIFGMHEKEGVYHIELTEWIGGQMKSQTLVPICCFEGDQIELCMYSNALMRSFSYQMIQNDSMEKQEEGNWIYVGTLDKTEYLSDEGYQCGKRFTGAMYGVYAWKEDKKDSFIPFFVECSK